LARAFKEREISEISRSRRSAEVRPFMSWI